MTSESRTTLVAVVGPVGTSPARAACARSYASYASCTHVSTGYHPLAPPRCTPSELGKGPCIDVQNCPHDAPTCRTGNSDSHEELKHVERCPTLSPAWARGPTCDDAQHACSLGAARPPRERRPRQAHGAAQGRRHSAMCGHATSADQRTSPRPIWDRSRQWTSRFVRAEPSRRALTLSSSIASPRPFHSLSTA